MYSPLIIKNRLNNRCKNDNAICQVEKNLLYENAISGNKMNRKGLKTCAKIKLSESIIFIRHHNYYIPYIQTAVNNLGGASKGASQIAGLQVFPKNSFFPHPLFQVSVFASIQRVWLFYIRRQKKEHFTAYPVRFWITFAVGAEVPLQHKRNRWEPFLFFLVVQGHVDIFRQLGFFFPLHFFFSSISWVSDPEEPEMSFVLFVVIHTLVLNWVWVIAFYNTTLRWEQI